MSQTCLQDSILVCLQQISLGVMKRGIRVEGGQYALASHGDICDYSSLLPGVYMSETTKACKIVIRYNLTVCPRGQREEPPVQPETQTNGDQIRNNRNSMGAKRA